TTFLEDYRQAVDILEDGLVTSREASFRQPLARVYLAWHDHLVRTKPNDLGPRLDLLEKGLRHDPTNADLLNRLVEVMHQPGADPGRARALREELVARGEASAGAHFALGVDAWRRGEQKLSLVHMERAYRLGPHLAVVANNLAWTLAHMPEPDLPRALEVI